MKKGFTLIEIVLAISFLLIITIMVVPNMYTVIENSNNKQLQKMESLIINAAKKYLSYDIATSQKIKECGYETSPVVGASLCDGAGEKVVYKNFYISLNDLVRMDLISANLKDPTQGNQEYDYSRVVEVFFDMTNDEYVYQVKDRDDATISVDRPIADRTLITKAFKDVYKYVWYSGLMWEVYKITDIPDPTALDVVTVASDDYLHLKLVSGNPVPGAFTTNIEDAITSCAVLGNALNNQTNLLVKYNGSYCNEVSLRPSVILKNKMLFVNGNGEISNSGTVIYNPFNLIGDYKGYKGKLLKQRFIGEYINYTGSATRIENISEDLIILENGEELPIESKIISGDGVLGEPYNVVGG